MCARSPGGTEQLSVSAQQTKIHLAIACWAWPNLFGADRMKGVRLGIADWAAGAEHRARRVQGGGLYMIGTLAKHKAEAEGFDDALMYDWRGQVAEGTGANICFVFGDEVHTPTPDCFLDSITRRAVSALAQRHQIKMVERAIMPEEMAVATEAFLVGTAAEVTPVRQIGPYSFTPGQITDTLLTEYEKLVRLDPAEVAKVTS